MDKGKVKERRLERVAESWESFFNDRRGQQRHGLTTPDLLALLERQGGRCALTGVALTRTRGRGRGSVCATNASVDRKNPGGDYGLGNVQLVCAAINRFRSDMSLEDFVEWCRRVVVVHDYNALQKIPA